MDNTVEIGRDRCIWGILLCKNKSKVWVANTFWMAGFRVQNIRTFLRWFQIPGWMEEWGYES